MSAVVENEGGRFDLLLSYFHYLPLCLRQQLVRLKLHKLECNNRLAQKDHRQLLETEDPCREEVVAYAGGNEDVQRGKEYGHGDGVGDGSDEDRREERLPDDDDDDAHMSL